MQKSYLVFLIIVALIGSFGVQGCLVKEEEVEGLGAYIGGSQGLDISFVSGEPPETVLDNNQDPFYITLLLKNNGEYTVPAGKVIASLSGIDKEAFSIGSLSAKSDVDIDKKQKETEGGEEELRFDQAKYKYDLKADFLTSIRADVCYLYESDAVSNICLKKEATKRDEDDVCAVLNENVGVDSSGAPVQITSVRQKPSGTNQVKVTFTIKKAGSGNVYESDAFSDVCSGQDEKKDKLKIGVTSPGRLSIGCGALNGKAEGTVRLIDGEKTVSCDISTAGLQEIAYRTQLQINAKYFYRDAIAKPLTVENAEY